MDMITIDDFTRVDIRCGRIIEVQDFPEARVPSFRIKVDFGSEIGVKRSCAQLTVNYTKESLLGKLIAGVVNLPPRKIGPEISEVLIVGFPDGNGKAVLLSPDIDVDIGGKLF